MFNAYIRRVTIFIVLVRIFFTVTAEIAKVPAQLDEGEVETGYNSY